VSPQAMPRAPRLPSPGVAATATAESAIIEAHRRITGLHQQFLRQQEALTRLLAVDPLVVDDVLDPDVDTWLHDHCPHPTVPVLPMMCIADRLAGIAAGYADGPVHALREVTLRRWLPVPRRVHLRGTATGPRHAPSVTLLRWREASDPRLSGFDEVATAVATTEAPVPPVRFAPLADAVPVGNPYRTATVFHGLSFQYLSSASIGTAGACGTLDAARGTVPSATLRAGLLDAALHVLPHRELHRWMFGLPAGRAAFPHRLAWLRLYEPLPAAGFVDVEARFAGTTGDPHPLPVIDVQLCTGERVLVDFRLVAVLVTADQLSAYLAARPA